MSVVKSGSFSTVSAKLLWFEILPESFIRMVLKAKKKRFPTNLSVIRKKLDECFEDVYVEGLAVSFGD